MVFKVNPGCPHFVLFILEAKFADIFLVDLEKSGFAILIDSENQPEKWIFKKIAS